MTDRALVEIGVAAARGQSVPPQTRADVRRIATWAPLSPDPFLIEGAIAETEGRGQAAERLFVEARDHDPRSRGARYLLAERYFRTGRITDALIEMQALVRLQEGAAERFGPALAAYARAPGAVPPLKAFFRRYPAVEAAVLSVLASDPNNADLVLALASSPKPDPDWRVILISSLVSSGQYARAHSLWTDLAGGTAGQGLFNPSFATVSPPPPFNWAYPASTEGVAEPDGKGGLEILYYGRTNTIFASQLLLLAPGQYQLAMAVERARGGEGATRWLIRCANEDKVLATLPIRAGAIAVGFAVPAGCRAQWLELHGVAGDMPTTSEVTIRGLRLSRGTSS